MTYMTPQEAQELLDGATPGPWKAWGIMRHPGTPTYILGKEAEQVAGSPHTDEGGIATHNRDLIVAAPRLAATIAADTIEYAVECDIITNDPDIPDGPELCYLNEDFEYWIPDADLAKESLEGFRERYPTTTYRLVARRASPTWEVEE